jgi:hypothetical protein
MNVDLVQSEVTQIRFHPAAAGHRAPPAGGSPGSSGGRVTGSSGGGGAPGSSGGGHQAPPAAAGTRLLRRRGSPGSAGGRRVGRAAPGRPELKLAQNVSATRLGPVSGLITSFYPLNPAFYLLNPAALPVDPSAGPETRPFLGAAPGVRSRRSGEHCPSGLGFMG